MDVITCFEILLMSAVIHTSRGRLDFDKNEISGEKKLMAELRHRYSILGQEGRPVWNVSQAVTVRFGLGLIKMELLEKENVLVMSTWARYMWRDEYLQWDPALYDNVQEVKLSPDMIWLPDVMLYNTAATEDSSRSVMAVVRHDGTVTYYPHTEFFSSCAVDIRNYPFDNQTCHLWFGSWAHPLSEMNLELAFPEGIDQSTFQSVYKDSSEWEIAEISASRAVMPEEGNPQFVVLQLKLSLKRKMMFSTYILTMPAILLSFLILLVFWIPAEAIDKTALGMTIFGSLLLLLLILVESAPPTAASVPLLGIFYCFTTMIVILSIFLSSLVLRLSHAGSENKPLPKWMRVVFLKGLATLLCKKISRKASEHVKHGSHSLKQTVPEIQTNKSESYVITRDLNNEVKVTNAVGLSRSISQLEFRLHALQVVIGNVISKQKDKELEDDKASVHKEEWQAVASLLDRLFFFIYLVAIIISLIFLLPKWW